MAESTRVERPRKREPTRITVMLPPTDVRTRLIPGAPARVKGLGWEERIALFAQALDRERAPAVLTGLASESAQRAGLYLDSLARLPSPERQGRVAAEFGILNEASQNLRRVWVDAGPALRREIFRQLPPYHRSVFPEYRPEPAEAGGEPAPALRDFAARLIREATR